jgi:hypothetical protein
MGNCAQFPAGLLAQIAANESTCNYAAGPPAPTAQNPNPTASGGYQIINTTWALAAANIGIDLNQYPTAQSAPPAVQDAAAQWLLNTYGANAPITWAASAPAGGYASTTTTSPIVELSGAAANIPTSDILSQIDTSISNVVPGLDPNVTLALLVAGVVGAVLLFTEL